MSHHPDRSGYLGQRRSRASGLAVVIALHGAALAAALLAKGAAIVALPPDVFSVYNVDPPQAPPELPPPPVEPEAPLPGPVVTDMPVSIDRPFAELPDPQPIDLGPPPVPVPPAPPPPDPVLVDARFDPAHMNALQPPYPPRMLRAGREGSVTVRVRIGADGRVTAVERISADDDAFFEATRRQALAAWRFVPATRDGRPVPSWQRHTVRFELT